MSVSAFITHWLKIGMAAVILTVMTASVAFGQTGGDRLKLTVGSADGYGRILLNFPGRLSLPKYTISDDGNVLVIAFEKPVNTILPEVTEQLGDYVAVARLDPDLRGIRFGLKGQFVLDLKEAGERLYIDLLPPSWRGLPPGLPAEVVSALAKRAEIAAAMAEVERKAELARVNPPEVGVRIGRGPTFTRIKFEWSIETEADFSVDGDQVRLAFEWPVPINIAELTANLPGELIEVVPDIADTESVLLFTMAKGTVARFFPNSNGNDFALDFDFAARLEKKDPLVASLDAEMFAAMRAQTEQDAAVTEAAVAAEESENGDPALPIAKTDQVRITPFINEIGDTVRVIFPFEQDTPAAVFRRGDTIWMLFDTHVQITQPDDPDAFAILGDGYEVDRASELQIVRMNVSGDRLATLGAEGRAWVLSLGDILYAPTEPVEFERRRRPDGPVQLVADMGRPARVHQIRDPEVGDILEVVTAYAPARGVIRKLDFVDFSAIRAVHGLVVRPQRPEVSVAIEGNLVVLDASDGLTLSEPVDLNTAGTRADAISRASFIDLEPMVRADRGELSRLGDELMGRAADSEGPYLDAARLDLARFYLANQMAQEALGVLDVLVRNGVRKELADKIHLARAAANVLARRPTEALAGLLADKYVDALDAVMWRTMARAETGDWVRAREDSLLAESAVGQYPEWVQLDFYLAATRAAVENADGVLASRFMAELSKLDLSTGDAAVVNVLAGRIDEIEGRDEEALYTYAGAIAAGFRPARAEAVLRTMIILDRLGKLDINRAAQTLAVEQLVWRGDGLEARMQLLLGELYFRNANYRLGFETMRQASKAHENAEETRQLFNLSRATFADLYLNGKADALEPVTALGIFYDFRQLTPSGTRGDEMIRNLARRLIDVDLLDQAAGLLEYQVDNRLEGAGRSAIAADLAVIRLADRRPDLALKALYRTQLANLPFSLDRRRKVLEAKALIDAGRNELALDLLASLEGADADLLRIDANWRGKRYREAGELLEGLYATQVGNEAALSNGRGNLIKAAVAYALASDEIGLTRLRAKFSTMMAGVPEWPMFNFVTSRSAPSSYQFRAIAREIAGVDSLNAFLDAYRARYGDSDALMPLQAGGQGAPA
jgi:hypothetical protein